MAKIIQFPVRTLTHAEIINKHNARVLNTRLGKKAAIVNYNYFLQKKFQQQVNLLDKKDEST